jgi:hypothetical protein
MATDTERGLTELLEARRDRLELLPFSVYIDKPEYMLLIDLALAVDAAGPWPRYQSVQIQSFYDTWIDYCVDCGMQHDLPHRDGCFGVRMASALDALLAHLAGEAT